MLVQHFRAEHEPARRLPRRLPAVSRAVQDLSAPVLQTDPAGRASQRFLVQTADKGRQADALVAHSRQIGLASGNPLPGAQAAELTALCKPLENQFTRHFLRIRLEKGIITLHLQHLLLLEGIGFQQGCGGLAHSAARLHFLYLAPIISARRKKAIHLLRFDLHRLNFRPF